MNCFGKKHDNYLKNFILPITSLKKALPISFYNFINELKGDVYDKCENTRKSYLDKVNN